MNQSTGPGSAALDLPPPKNRANAFFRAFARSVLRMRWALGVGTLAVTLVMIYASVTRLRVDNSTEAFLASNGESAAVLEELRDAFGQDTLFQILVTGDVFSVEYLERLRALHREIEGLDMDLESLGKRRRPASGDRAAKHTSPDERPAAPAQASSDGEFAGFEDFADSGGGQAGWGDEGGGTIVDEVLSLVNARLTSWSGGGMRVAGLLDEWPTQADLPRLRREVLASPTLLGNVVGQSGRHSVVVVRTQFMDEQDQGRVYERLREIAEHHETEGFQLEVAGAPALFVALNERMLDDLALTFGVSNVLMLLIMFWMFRHPLGVIGPMLVCIQAAVWTMGTLAISDRPMTMITNVLPAFLLCVGVGDSIHVQSVYRDARRKGHANYDAIVYAVGATGMPVLFTSITTAIGLLSFRFAHLEAIRDMGTFGAFGVMAALLASLVFLPIVLSFNTKSLLGAREPRRGSDRLDAFLSFCNELSRPKARSGKARSHRLTVLGVGLVLAGASIAAALTLRVYHNSLGWFPEDDVTRVAVENLDEHVGGMATIALLVEAPAGDNLRHREALVALQSLERHILAYRDPNNPDMISNATSLLDVVRESWRAVHEGDPDFYSLPKDERGVQDMLTLFENAGPQELSKLATIDLAKSVMTVRARWLDASAYRPLVEYIDAGVARFFPQDITVKPTGTIYATVDVVETLLLDLVRSFGTAFVVITLLMVVLLKDVRLGLIAMVPNLLPILLVMGFMVVFDIAVDTNTLMVASIAIGIAVDDTIHFLHQFRSHMQLHGDVEEAIDYAFSHTGRALVSTSAILVTGFLSLHAGYMGNVKVFGSLIALTVVFALLSDLIFSPALLRTVYRSRKPALARAEGLAAE